MKRKKSKVGGWKARYDSSIADRCRKLAVGIDSRFRMSAKVAVMNRWAVAHPRKFFRYAVSAMAVVLLLGLSSILLSDCGGTHHGTGIKETVNEIHRTSSLIDRMRARQGTKTQERQLVDKLVSDADRIKREMDSICSKPKMTRDDSLLVISKRKQLEIIINTLLPDEKN